MSAGPSATTGPDLTLGVESDALADGQMLAGHVGEEAVLLARRGDAFFAIGSTCTHYGGPLAEGLMLGDTVRCPWHHACFSLRTGEAVRAPALGPVPCWSTEVRGGKVFVGEKMATSPVDIAATAGLPGKIVIVGGGAAGFAAAEMLRRRRFEGSIVMLSDDAAPPVDRPNLSKDYLAGAAPEEWVPLRDESFYTDARIDLRLQTAVTSIDVDARELALGDGSKLSYDRLLLATGAEPVRLPLPGMDLPHVHTLRTFADCRAIIAHAATAQRAVVLGASFIGLEVAASLRARELEVHVIAPEKLPMERVLGPQLGDFVRKLHEQHGVIFHLGDTATAIDAHQVVLKSGGTIGADLVVAGVGVRPRLALAEKAGLVIDRGVIVNEYLGPHRRRRHHLSRRREPDGGSGNGARISGEVSLAREEPDVERLWQLTRRLLRRAAGDPMLPARAGSSGAQGCAASRRAPPRCGRARTAAAARGRCGAPPEFRGNANAASAAACPIRTTR